MSADQFVGIVAVIGLGMGVTSLIVGACFFMAGYAKRHEGEEGME